MLLFNMCLNLDTAPEPPFGRRLGRIYGACGTAAEPPGHVALGAEGFILPFATRSMRRDELSRFLSTPFLSLCAPLRILLG